MYYYGYNQWIEKDGHEIGLHFEAMNVGRALCIDAEKLLRKEKKLIELILGHEVLTCSEHRELSCLIHKTQKFDELYNPYNLGFKFYSFV